MRSAQPYRVAVLWAGLGAGLYATAGASPASALAPVLASAAASVGQSPAAPQAVSPAAARPRAVEPGASLRVYLMTMGPGDAVWEKFGHNALWIHDPERRVDPAFNYGIFSFEQPGFLGRLLRGNMLYTMAPYDAAQTVQHYAYFDRSVWAQELNLTPAQKLELYRFLEWNAEPEHADYLYDYFRDNCSTRVRDALDRALGGALRAALDTIPTGSTFRSESLRLTHADVAVSTGLLLALGPAVDRPLTAWEESFVPMRLSEHVARVSVTGEDGVAAPLVVGELALFTGSRSPLPARAPARTPLYLLAGLALAALLVAASFVAARAPVPGVLLGATAAWSIVIGFFGCLLALLWLVTDHTDTYRNVNLLFANPLSLVLGVLLAAAAARRRPPRRAAVSLALVIAGLALLGALLSALPLLRQVNGPIVALLAPPHLAAAWALYPWRGRGSSDREDTRTPAVRRPRSRVPE